MQQRCCDCTTLNPLAFTYNYNDLTLNLSFCWLCKDGLYQRQEAHCQHFEDSWHGGQALLAGYVIGEGGAEHMKAGQQVQQPLHLVLLPEGKEVCYMSSKCQLLSLVFFLYR